MLYMAVHPQQCAVKEPKVVRHIQIAYSYQVTHLVVQSNETLASQQKTCSCQWTDSGFLWAGFTMEALHQYTTECKSRVTVAKVDSTKQS